MPTTRYGRVRHLLNEGKAHVVSREPFTVQLDYDTTAYVQPIEVCVDAGYQHIGVSVKTEARELERTQYDLLPNEKERHDDQQRYRRTRRNRLRYRKPRFDNRKHHGEVKWLAPSVENKALRHIDIVQRIVSAVPVTDVYIEVGQFDTQVLAAVQEGKPIPQGEDYQHGEQYGIDTLREAVFQRDGYCCRFCGRSGIRDGAKLNAHHAYFWRGQHGNRLSELVTCCERCHTAANHQPGGKLYGFDGKLPRYTGAAFMNSVKWFIYEALKDLTCTVHLTYGAATKRSRIDLGLEKSHTNDAYSMGRFHPPLRAEEVVLAKRRRNNRILEKFYDAKCVDIRDGSKKSGAQLGCGRTSRRQPRNSDKSLRQFHGPKVLKGRRSIRRQRYPIQPGDLLLVDGKRIAAKGTHCNGSRVLCADGKSIAVKKVITICHADVWQKVKQKGAAPPPHV